MKASDVIGRLQRLMERYGDQEVYIGESYIKETLEGEKIKEILALEDDYKYSHDIYIIIKS